MSQCLEEAIQLQKLKLSSTCLNDAKTVDKLCKIIQTKPFLTHLDLSWSKLSPKNLLDISVALVGNFKCIRNLNLSYNSLYTRFGKTDVAHADEDDNNMKSDEDDKEEEAINELDLTHSE